MKKNIETTWQIGKATVTRIEELPGPSLQPEELLATWDPAVLKEHGIGWRRHSIGRRPTSLSCRCIHA